MKSKMWSHSVASKIDKHIALAKLDNTIALRDMPGEAESDQDTNDLNRKTRRVSKAVLFSSPNMYRESAGSCLKEAEDIWASFLAGTLEIPKDLASKMQKEDVKTPLAQAILQVALPLYYLYQVKKENNSSSDQIIDVSQMITDRSLALMRSIFNQVEDVKDLVHLQSVFGSLVPASDVLDFMSDIIATPKGRRDESFPQYFVDYLEYFYAKEPLKTVAFIDRFIEESIGDHAAIGSVASFIQKVCKEFPVICRQDEKSGDASKTVNQLIDTFSAYVYLMPDAGIDDGIYKLPIVDNITPLINYNSDIALALLNRVLLSGESMDTSLLEATLKQLTLINDRKPALSAALFTRLTQLELSVADRGLLEKTGVRIFADNIAAQPLLAQQIWQDLLQMETRSGVRHLVEKTLPNAQHAFVGNPTFAKQYFAALDEVCGNTEFSSGLAAAEYVMQQTPSGFAIVTSKNMMAIEGKTVGAVASVLADLIKDYGSDIRTVMPLIEFVASAQAMLKDQAEPLPKLGQVIAAKMRIATAEPG